MAQCLVLILLFALTSLAADAETHLKPISLTATCDSKLTSILLSSFKETIQASQRYEVVTDLTDNGKMDVVFVIQIVCNERNNAVSVASIYGLAKCIGPKLCHQAMDATTLNLLMCDPNSETQCGKELFKEFEFVLANADMSSLHLD